MIIRRTYNLNDNLTRIVITSRLKGKAMEWFYLDANNLNLTTAGLIYEIKKMFYFSLSKIDLREKFEDRVWLISESFCQYAYDKSILANKANVYNPDLVDYLIEGIPDETLRDQAKMQRFESKEGLLKAFEKI